MLEADDTLEIVREWVIKAENDLKNAAHTLKIKENCPTDTVCFHAQQCVEKYLKAVLTLKGIDFPKTHDIGVLVSKLPARIRPEISPEEERRLTDYATITRYPGDYEHIPVSEARKAVQIARRARKDLRKILPGKVKIMRAFTV